MNLSKRRHCSVRSVSAFDIRQDLKFTKFFSTGYSPCVKTGAGSMIFEGETVALPGTTVKYYKVFINYSN